MPESVVLRNRNLPGQPVVVEIPDGCELSPEYEAAGWRVAKTDPEAIPVPPTVPPEDNQAEPASDTTQGE